MKGLMKQKNLIMTVLFLAILCIACGLRYDYYYDLNDDVLMKDILAGVYTGTPESRNIQMLYLISAFISFFYRIVPGAPWYGLFLCICQFGSIGLIVYRSLKFVHKTPGKVLLLLTEGVVVIGTMLEHLVFVQYTITCTMLAAAAAFLFYTTDINLDNKTFFKKNLPAMVLVFIAFLVRSEMLALVLPMIGVAGVCKWGCEKPVFTKEHAVKYFSVLGGILAGLIIGQGTHMIAHSSAEWQKFNEFFDNRTELYDYQVIPDYAEHTAFYESIGLSESEEILFHNYNVGLDEEIDEKLVGEIADYAGANRKVTKPFNQQFTEKAQLYIYKMTHGGPHGDFPFNALIIIGYASLLGMGISQRKNGSMVWKLLLLLSVRTALWMYILMGDRDPARITHSLYYMEFCILMAMTFVEGKALKTWKTFPAVIGVLILVTAITNLPGMITSMDQKSVRREEVNRPWQAMQEYCRQHPDNYYFVDVYSSVDYSEKMFAGVDNRLANYDIMGGWACKSPLYQKKMAAFEMPVMEEALLSLDNTYIIVDFEYELTWLKEYYRGHGQEIAIEQVGNIADKMGVYRIYDESKEG